MIIILEGPDAAGKTTLAGILRKLIGEKYRYLHDRYHPGRQFYWDTAILRQAVKNELRGETTIVDRHWIGDNIYGSVFRNGGELWVRRVDSVLQRFGASYIICCPEPRVLEAEFQEVRNTRPEKFHSMIDVAQRFNDLVYGSSDRPIDGDYVEQQSHAFPWAVCRRMVIHYDRFAIHRDNLHVWLKHNILPCFQQEADFARNADPLTRELDSWELSGSLRCCQALLVGERAMHLDAPVNWPFYSNKESAAYLTKALHKARICETDIAITNARSVRNNTRDNFMKIIRWLKENRQDVRIVALGNEAKKSVQFHGYSVDAVLPHPQWARRFDHHGDYHMQLKAAVYGT